MWIHFRVPSQDGVKQPSKVVCQVSGFVSGEASTSFVLRDLCIGQVLGDANRVAQYGHMEQWIQGHGPLPLPLTSDHLLKMAEFFPVGMTSLSEIFGLENRVPLSVLADRGELRLTKALLEKLRFAFVGSSRFLQPEMAESAIVFKIGTQYFLNATCGSTEVVTLALDQVDLNSKFPLDFYYP